MVWLIAFPLDLWRGEGRGHVAHYDGVIEVEELLEHAQAFHLADEHEEVQDACDVCAEMEHCVVVHAI